MAPKTTPYDPADYLKSDEDFADYLEAIINETADDDPDTAAASIANALGVIARAGNMSALARDIGVTREGLYKALSKDGNPTLATVIKVAKVKGLQLSFRPAKAA
jgi:probable addiction module antidote protein